MGGRIPQGRRPRLSELDDRAVEWHKADHVGEQSEGELSFYLLETFAQSPFINVALVWKYLDSRAR